jgi:hypothetical protein
MMMMIRTLMEEMIRRRRDTDLRHVMIDKFPRLTTTTTTTETCDHHRQQ